MDDKDMETFAKYGGKFVYPPTTPIVNEQQLNDDLKTVLSR